MNRAARLRAAWPDSGLAPAVSTDHAADLARVLAAMPVAPLVAVVARSSRGEAWAVTRLSHSMYQVAHRDGRYAMGALAYVVELMEETV